MTVHATVRQLDQMTRILVLRVSHATRRYQQQKIVVEELLQKVAKLREEVKQLDLDRESVVRFLDSPDALTDPIKLSDANIRRRWLVYDREKSAYYLDIALDDLAEAETELALKKNVWLKAQARETQTRDQRRAAVNQADMDREFKESLDIQEQVSNKVQARG